MSGTTLVPLGSIRISPTGISPSTFSFSKTVRLSFLNPKRWSSTPKDKSFGLASFPFARRYLGNRCFFLFLRVLRCFSSPGYLLYTYGFSIGYIRITVCGLPHSDIHGSMDMCSSPWLIAACHVLLRLLVPRHPPCALSCLTCMSTAE